MRISYYSPNKNVKTFSFANMKPVLIFTADKNKESVKDKENILTTSIKKKLIFDNNFNNKNSNGNTDLNVSSNNSNLNKCQNGIPNGNQFYYYSSRYKKFK